MKKLLPSALLLALVLAWPAQAQVVSHRSNEHADSVRAYWTAERMRNARPVERAKGGKPGGGGSTSTWSTLAVAWPANSLLDAHGKVFFSDGTYNYVCSGTAMASSSESIVWTAGHCVNEGPGAYYTNFMFVPAYNKNGVQAPFGRFTSSKLYTTAQWRDSGDFGYDLGAAKVGLNESNLTLVDATLAARQLGTTTSAGLALNTRVKSYGYPAAGKYNGQTMYVCDSYISRRDSSTSPATYGIPCGMTGGSSGGGWITADEKLVSVNSYGYQSLKNTMFGPVQESTASNLLTAANAG